MQHSRCVNILNVRSAVCHLYTICICQKYIYIVRCATLEVITESYILLIIR